MTQKLLLLFLILTTSCPPSKIAPRIKTYKIVRGQKFSKSLLQHYCFVFKDPKNAYEFYNYVNTVYQRNDVDVDKDVPFQIDRQSYYFSSREAEKINETFNIVPLLLDKITEHKGYGGPYLNAVYTSRKGHWYILINVFDNEGNDALHPKHPEQKEVIKYLEKMRTSYLSHQNYYEVLLLKK